MCVFALWVGALVLWLIVGLRSNYIQVQTELGVPEPTDSVNAVSEWIQKGSVIWKVADHLGHFRSRHSKQPIRKKDSFSDQRKKAHFLNFRLRNEMKLIDCRRRPPAPCLEQILAPRWLLSVIDSLTAFWMLFNELVRKKVKPQCGDLIDLAFTWPIVPQLRLIVFYFKVNLVSEPSR